MESERYQIQFSSEQMLLQPHCPVHVQKLQCTRDRLTGRLYLQVRYVNRSSMTVSSLVVCVEQLDGDGNMVSVIQSLSVPGLHAKPHTCFGDEKTIILSALNAKIQVIIEQVCFSDGQVWRKRAEDAPVAIHEPVRICGKLQPSRHDGYWYCTCGLVNPGSEIVCGYCGKPAPLAAPRPVTPPPPAPPEPETVSAQDAEAEFPVIEPTLPPTPAPPKKRRHIAAWVIGILLVLAALVAAGFFWGYPMFQYYQGSHLYNQGNYEQAAEIFSSLSTYKDAAERVIQCRFNLAYQQLQSGEYDSAYQAFLDLSEDPRSHAMALNCLQKQLHAAMACDDYTQACVYLERADQLLAPEEAPPEWRLDAVPWLTYHEGLACYNDGNYQAAFECFSQSDYGDSQEYLTDCTYHLAQEALSEDRFDESIETFASLGDYKDAPQLLLQAMQGYVRAHFNAEDAKTAQYLQALIAAGAEDAQSQYNELFAWEVEFSCNDTLDNLALFEIGFHVTAGPPDGSTTDLVLTYMLPNGKSGTIPLAENVKIDDSGTLLWKNTGITDASKGIFSFTVTEVSSDRVIYTKEIDIN